jgi:hypothetical protein
MKLLIIVTALMPEAVPIIDFYRMQKQPKRPFHHLFKCISSGQTFELHLIITGIGAKNMYRGLKAYLSAEQNVRKAAYLNFGIAGASSEPIGKLLWANAIAATSIGFPAGVYNLPYTVRSVDFPSQQYQSGILFDMEAEACMQCITENTQQFAPQALFCAKVVSDNQSEYTHNIEKHWVKDIVYKNINELVFGINKIIKSIE